MAKKNNNKAKSFEQKGKDKGRAQYTRKPNTEVENGLERGKSATFKSAFTSPNDVAWYAKTPQMLESSANLAMNHITGVPFKVGKDYEMNTPGICELRWTPCPGVGSKATDAINVAARNVYAHLRAANSGAVNYQPADYMMYLLAVDSLISYHAQLMRVYGTINYWMPLNKYTGKYMVEALGYDYDDLVHNLADFKYTIDQFARRINGQLIIPNSIPMLARHVWMNTHIYMDRPSTRAQFYFYNMNGALKFSEMEGESRPYTNLDLEIINQVGRKINLTEIRDVIEGLLENITNSGSVAIMVGDTRKAFGDGSTIQVPYLDPNYQCVPVYDAEVLSQMHNFHCVGPIYYSDLESFVSQSPSTNVITCTPRVHLTDSSAFLNSEEGGSVMVDFKSDNVTAADVMVATRMVCAVGPTSSAPNGSGLVADVTVAGTEIANLIVVHEVSGTNLAHYPIPTFSALIAQIDFTTNISVSDFIKTNLTALYLYKLGTFAYAPIVYLAYLSYKSTGSNILVETIGHGFVGEVDNFVPVSIENIQRMHECALLSELNVPGLSQ